MRSGDAVQIRDCEITLESSGRSHRVWADIRRAIPFDLLGALVPNTYNFTSKEVEGVPPGRTNEVDETVCIRELEIHIRGIGRRHFVTLHVTALEE